MRISKLIKVFLCWLVMISAVNGALSFALVPNSNASKVMWKAYEKEETIDTVFTGSSLVQRLFDPYLYDENTGSHSFNMGTPSQPLEQSLQGIEKAIKDHHIDTCVVGVGYFSFIGSQSVNAKVAYYQSMRNASKNKLQLDWKFITDPQNFGKEESINYLFPWVYNHDYDFSANITKKLNHDDGMNDEMVNNGLRHYVGKGYGYLTNTINYDTDTVRNSWNTYDSHTISASSLATLGKICKVCKDNHVNVLVINSPRPVYDVLSYGSGNEYFDNKSVLEQFLSAYEVPYYDFNLIKKDYLRMHEDWFSDYEHVNQAGAEAFTKFFAEFMDARKNGEKVDDWFYKTPEEYTKSIDYISAVNCSYQISGNSLKLDAYAYSGLNPQKIEYELCSIKNDGSQNILVPYQTNSHFEVSLSDQKICINVRIKGESSEYDKRCIRTIQN